MIIDELEGSLTGAPIDATNHEVTEVTIESNYDYYSTSGFNFRKINKYIDEMEIDFREEWMIEKYKVTLNIDIENIIKIENIHNHPKINWRIIYKIIQH